MTRGTTASDTKPLCPKSNSQTGNAQGRVAPFRFGGALNAAVRSRHRTNDLACGFEIFGCSSFGLFDFWPAEVFKESDVTRRVASHDVSIAVAVPIESHRRCQRTEFQGVSCLFEINRRRKNRRVIFGELAHVFDKRGKEAMADEKSVLPKFKGVAVYDCWGSYFWFSEMKHAICNAHILRELNGIIENKQTKWAIKMKELLLEMYRESDFGKGIIEENGTQSYCRIQSFISRLRKQSRRVFQELLSVMQGNHFKIFQI